MIGILPPLRKKPLHTTPSDPLRCWLALLHLPGVGPVTVQKLLKEFANPCDFWQADTTLLAQCGLPKTLRKNFVGLDQQAIDRDIAWASRPYHHIISLEDERYPAILREIHDPPIVLFVVGNPEVLNHRQIAVVGTRSPSHHGITTASVLARDLVEVDVAITSGLALGIDAAAHQGAMAAKGLTVAVMGTGPEQIYPLGHRQMADDIVRHGGILITEFPVGTTPHTGNFPRRNRILSGMTLGTVVVEAGEKSGAIITARLAADQGRDVFAVPGSIYNPKVRGCHQLIRQGEAKLVETAKDILEEYNPSWARPFMRTIPSNRSNPPNRSDTPSSYEGKKPAVSFMPVEHEQEQTIILEILGYNDPLPTDLIAHRSGLTLEKVSIVLQRLELQGLVSTIPGGFFLRMN